MTTKTHFTETELCHRLKSGDYNAFNQIYQQYSAGLLQYGYNKLRNREDARDLLNDVFSKIWEIRATLEINLTLKSYLFTCARNLIFKQYKKEQRHDDYMVTLLEHVKMEYNHTDYPIREKQFRDQIEEEITKLTPRIKEVFELSRNKKLTHSEIAEALGITEGTVSRHISDAIKTLKQSLSTYISLL